MVNILPILLFLAAAGFAIFTAAAALANLQKNNEYTKASGTIIDFIDKNRFITIDRTPLAEKQPVIAYEVNGQNYTFVGSCYYMTMRKNDTVEILYDTERPEKAIMADSLTAMPVMTGAIAMLLFLIGAAIAILLRLC